MHIGLFRAGNDAAQCLKRDDDVSRCALNACNRGDRARTSKPIHVLLEIPRHRVDSLELDREIAVQSCDDAQHFVVIRPTFSAVQSSHLVEGRASDPTRPEPVGSVLHDSVQIDDKVPSAQPRDSVRRPLSGRDEARGGDLRVVVDFCRVEDGDLGFSMRSHETPDDRSVNVQLVD